MDPRLGEKSLGRGKIAQSNGGRRTVCGRPDGPPVAMSRVVRTLDDPGRVWPRVWQEECMPHAQVFRPKSQTDSLRIWHGSQTLESTPSQRVVSVAFNDRRTKSTRAPSGHCNCICESLLADWSTFRMRIAGMVTYSAVAFRWDPGLPPAQKPVSGVLKRYTGASGIQGGSARSKPRTPWTSLVRISTARKQEQAHSVPCGKLDETSLLARQPASNAALCFQWALGLSSDRCLP